MCFKDNEIRSCQVSGREGLFQLGREGLRVGARASCSPGTTCKKSDTRATQQDRVGALWQRKPHRSRKREKKSRLGKDSELEVQGEWQVGFYPWETMKGSRQSYNVWFIK